MTKGTHKLERNVGLLALTLYGVGDILGSGIYGLIGKAAGEMGTAVWLAFFVSMIAAGLTGLSYACLGSRYPRAGGAAYVTYRAYKMPLISYVVGLAALASGLTSMATAARVFAGYFSGLVWPSAPVSVVAVVFALLLGAVVFKGIKESLFANSLFTVVELSGLLLILIVGAGYVGSVNYLDFSTVANPTGEWSISLLLSGAVLTFFSFVGFEDMVNVAEEVKDPQKTLPRGLLLAIAISSIVYMGVSLVAVSVVPPAELKDSARPLVEVVARAAPWFPLPLFSVIAMFAVSNTALLNFIMGSRLLYGMANHGLVPAALGHVHGKTRTPHKAVLTVLAIYVLLILSGDISSLARATSVLLLIIFIAINVTLVVLKRRENIKGSFEVPVFVPVLGAIINMALLFHSQAAEWKVAGTLLAVIVVLYFIMRPQGRDVEAMDEM